MGLFFVMRRLIGIFVFIVILLLSVNTAVFSQSRDFVKFETAKEHFKKGFHYFNERKYLAAVEFFRKALSEYPQYYTAREYLARSYSLSGYIDEAVKEWEILSNSVSKNVSIVNKINTIKYRETGGQFISDSFDFLLIEEYKSVDLRRFRVPYPIDIAIDRGKNIYVTSFSLGKVVKLGPNGEGKESFSPGSDSRFYGIDYWKDRICLSDFKMDSIYILNTDLEVLKSFGSSGSNNGEFHGPEGVSLDSRGNIYIVDSGNHRIQKCDKDGNYILKFGEKGEYNGHLKTPSSIVVSDDTVYITDTGNQRVVSFDDSGNFIRNIIDDDMKKPRGIDIYEDKLIISDEENGLLFYGLKNEKRKWFNSWNNKKDTFAKLISSEIDRDGALYCLDYKRDSVLVFSSLKNKLSNLNIEVTSIDTRRYPAISLYLNIRSRNGKPVYGLDNTNFIVNEDGVDINQISVNYFKEVDKSVSLVLCVDRSLKTSGYHNEIPWVSDFFLKKMKKNDSIRVLNFNKDSWEGNNFDWSRRRTISVLRKRDYSEGKCFGKVLYNAITDLISRHNRRGVILISDGTITADSFKQYSQRNIIEYAKCHYIPVYFIVFKSKEPILERIARETGGEILKANEIDNMRKIYYNIKNSEEYRYLLDYFTYNLTGSNGWWADVKIEVNHKGQNGIEWCGYFVP